MDIDPVVEAIPWKSPDFYSITAFNVTLLIVEFDALPKNITNPDPFAIVMLNDRFMFYMSIYPLLFVSR